MFSILANLENLSNVNVLNLTPSYHNLEAMEFDDSNLVSKFYRYDVIFSIEKRMLPAEEDLYKVVGTDQDGNELIIARKKDYLVEEVDNIIISFFHINAPDEIKIGKILETLPSEKRYDSNDMVWYLSEDNDYYTPEIQVICNGFDISRESTYYVEDLYPYVDHYEHEIIWDTAHAYIPKIVKEYAGNNYANYGIQCKFSIYEHEIDRDGIQIIYNNQLDAYNRYKQYISSNNAI